jgi:hypothetical protein
LEVDESTGQYPIKGGKTILGRLFAYQEKTGMPVKDIMKLPWIMFIIGMLDAPSIDYDGKKSKKESINTPVDAAAEIAAFTGVLR